MSEWQFLGEHLLTSTEGQVYDMRTNRLVGDKEEVRLNGRTKISDEDVEKIRVSYANKEATTYQLADQYGVSQGQISGICNRKYRK